LASKSTRASCQQNLANCETCRSRPIRCTIKWRRYQIRAEEVAEQQSVG
jgi:hypothetical protein